MQLSRRNDIGIEIVQATAFALLVAFVYHYFGPTATTTPSAEVFVAMTVGVVLLVATVRRPVTIIVQKPVVEALTDAQTAELSQKLREAGWMQLEKIVGDIYVKLGCATWRRSNSERENNFSLVIERAGQKTAVMCKPWRATEVTSPDVIEFTTEMKQAGISHGVFVTLQECTAPALKVAETLGVDVVNEEALLQLIAGTGEKFGSELLAELNDVSKASMTESATEIRTAAKGFRSGEKFWSCSAAAVRSATPQ